MAREWRHVLRRVEPITAHDVTDGWPRCGAAVYAEPLPPLPSGRSRGRPGYVPCLEPADWHYVTQWGGEGREYGWYRCAAHRWVDAPPEREAA